MGCLCDYGKHKWLGMSLQTLHANCCRRIFKGRSSEKIELLVEQFLNENLTSFLYKPIVDTLSSGQNRGEYILILSSSPDFLVGAIARRLSVEHWKATSYHIDKQGKFNGGFEVMDGKIKAQVVSMLAKKLSLPLKDVTVYSDSLLDLPLLKIAGEVICVCPSDRLKRLCWENGWKIIQEKGNGT
jgi:HAD superfamily hydrolase (TIGR01490 family)